MSSVNRGAMCEMGPDPTAGTPKIAVHAYRHRQIDWVFLDKRCMVGAMDEDFTEVYLFLNKNDVEDLLSRFNHFNQSEHSETEEDGV